MIGRLAALLVLGSSFAAAGGGLKLTAVCDEAGNLVLHGEGSFPAGETVDIRLLRMVGSSNEVKGGKQVVSASKSFDATLDPGDLPPGDYTVEVRVAQLSAVVGVKLASLRAIEEAREDEEKQLLSWLHRIKGWSKTLGEDMRVADEGDRGARLSSWEKSRRGQLSDLQKRQMSEEAGAKQTLVDLLSNLVVLAQVARGAPDNEIVDLLHKTMVVREDGSPKEASQVFEAGRKAFTGALADAFVGMMKKSLDEIDRYLARVAEPKKDGPAFVQAAGAWAARVTRTCDRHRAYAEGEGPYPSAMGEEIGRLRSILAPLAQAYCDSLDPQRNLEATQRATSLRQQATTLIDKLQDDARK